MPDRTPDDQTRRALSHLLRVPNFHGVSDEILKAFVSQAILSMNNESLKDTIYEALVKINNSKDKSVFVVTERNYEGETSWLAIDRETADHIIEERISYHIEDVNDEDAIHYLREALNNDDILFAQHIFNANSDYNISLSSRTLWDSRSLNPGDTID